MIDKELLGNLTKSLVEKGLSAQEIRDIAMQYLSKEELETLWRIPRQNITNFVLRCLENINLKPPFLDIGCGGKSYQPEFIERFGINTLYIALDHYLPDDKSDPLRLPNLLANTAFLPLAPSSMNTAICTEVLEHVEDDRQVLKEMSRVIRKEGMLILTLPGRDIPKHERLPYQIDYRRYAPDEVRNLLETYGFNILRLENKFLFTNLEINIFALAKKG